MIRWLADLAQECQIWASKIDARQSLWCQENLSPPFNFATVTTAPHLPFEDRYFDLIYCGSVFTHIDHDLADAWLLELKRIIRPGGRVYITVHDKHSADLIINQPERIDEGRSSGPRTMVALYRQNCSHRTGSPKKKIRLQGTVCSSRRRELSGFLRHRVFVSALGPHTEDDLHHPRSLLAPNGSLLNGEINQCSGEPSIIIHARVCGGARSPTQCDLIQ